MTEKPELLYIAHRIPYPPNKGDKIRTFHQIKFLSRHFCVDLVALVDDPDDFQYKAHLEGHCRSVHLFGLSRPFSYFKGVLGLVSGASISQGYFDHGRARRKIARLLASHRYRAVVCFSSPTAGLLPKDFQFRTTRKIMDFCDVDSEKWRQYAQVTSGLMGRVYGIEARRLRQYERKVHEAFDASVFVSRAEADLFAGMIPCSRKVFHVSNGVDCRYFSPILSPILSDPVSSPGHWQETGTLVLMFPGAMDYYANVQAVSWFCEHIMPGLSKRLAKDGIRLRFDIVGKNPVSEVRALAAMDGVRVTGFVEDIRPYYRAADIVVIPIQIARGIQNKVLEAMAMGLPVVGTPQALEGIEAEGDTPCRSAVSPEDFIREVIEFVQHPSMARYLGDKARTFVDTRFSWQACLAPMVGIIHGKA